MNRKQRKFADEYLIDLNATQAAIRAGYSKKTAKSLGQRLLTFVDVSAYINEQHERIHNERTADAQEVLEYLTSVMRGETQSEVVTVVGIGDGLSEARNVLKAPEERDRLKAAELLGKRYRLFTEKVDLEAEVGVVIVDDITEES